MLEDDVKAEQEAIQFCKKFQRLCIELDDPVTRLLYEEILTDEEDHEYKFNKTLLEKKRIRGLAFSWSGKDENNPLRT